MVERRRAGQAKRKPGNRVRHARRSPASAEAHALRAELDRANVEIERLRRRSDELARRAQDGEHAKSTVARLSQELRNRTLRMEQQLAVARQFQRLFMPPVLPTFPQVHFAVKYQPSPRVGGDLYDVCDMGNSCVGVLVADAAGNGLSATLITAIAKIAFDTFRQNEYSPKVILEKMNQHIVRNTLEDQFLTAFLGILDLETLRLKFANASHTCPILYSPKRFETLDTEGLCCGMFEEPRCEEKEIQLQAGDRLFLYTRGLVRMCNARSQAYPERRLHKLLKANRDLEIGAMVEQVAEDFSRHLGGAEQAEDLTLVGLEVAPRRTKEEHIVIRSEPMQLARVESLILSRLEALNYGERALFAVRLALEEAVINAIKHGNRMDKAKRVTVTFSADREECVVAVEDEGQGFDPASVPDPTTDENLELPHGRGLVLMRAYMDEVKFNAKGNRVTMRKKAPWAP
jgi:serine phosphatase RsbU (regulator of sigma subunit)/anti-sigma regulatory factor (Ser/Thr protein kinase)